MGLRAILLVFLVSVSTLATPGRAQEGRERLLPPAFLAEAVDGKPWLHMRGPVRLTARQWQERLEANGHTIPVGALGQQAAEYERRGGVEVLELRGDAIRAYRMPDGRISSMIGLLPLHYTDASGNLVAADPAIERSDADGFAYESLRNRYRTWLPASYADGVRLVTAEGHPIGFAPAGIFYLDAVAADGSYDEQSPLQPLLAPRPGAADVRIARESIRYHDTYRGVDDFFLLYPWLLKHDMIVREPFFAGLPSARTEPGQWIVFSSVMEVPSRLQLSDQAGGPVESGIKSRGRMYFHEVGQDPQHGYMLPTPLAAEENDSEVVFCYHRIRPAGATATATLYAYDILVPYAWMADAETQYPVIVDPSFALETNTVHDQDQSGLGDTFVPFGNAIITGSNGSEWRSYGHNFDLLDNPAYAATTSLEVQFYHNSGCLDGHCLSDMGTAQNGMAPMIGSPIYYNDVTGPPQKFSGDGWGDTYGKHDYPACVGPPCDTGACICPGGLPGYLFSYQSYALADWNSCITTSGGNGFFAFGSSAPYLATDYTFWEVLEVSCAGVIDIMWFYTNRVGVVPAADPVPPQVLTPPPLATPCGMGNLTQGCPVSIPLDEDAVCCGCYTVVAGALPNGLIISCLTGDITGTPNVVGPYDFTVQFTDCTGLFDTERYTGDVCAARTITTPSLPNAIAGVPYSQVVTTAGECGVAPQSFALTDCGCGFPPIPGWLTLDPITGLLSGTPDVGAVGMTFCLDITVTGCYGCMDQTTLTLDVDPPVPVAPTCMITSPAAGAVVSGDVAFVVDGADPLGDPVDMVMEFSVDAGSSFSPTTTAPGGSLANPELGRPTPFAGLSYLWDSLADGVGTPFAQWVVFRITISQGVDESTCIVEVFVDNTLPPCQTGLLCGDCDANNRVDILDSLAAARMASGLRQPWDLVTQPDRFNACNVTGLEPPLRGAALTTADALVVAQYIVGLRLLACCRSVTGGPPTVNITSPGGGSANGDIAIVFDALDPDADPLNLVFEYDAGAGFLPATRSVASTLTNPHPGAMPGAGLVFVWNSVADLVGTFPGVVFRVTAADGTFAPVADTTVFTVDNNLAPGCSIISPCGGSFLGDVLVTFDASDPEGDVLNITFEFDAGGGFVMAADAGGGLPNPAPGQAPGLGLTFNWDSAMDLPAGAMGVAFRVTVDDGQASSCTTVVDIQGGGPPPCPALSTVGIAGCAASLGVGSAPEGAFTGCGQVCGTIDWVAGDDLITLGCTIQLLNVVDHFEYVADGTGGTYTFSFCGTTPAFDTILEIDTCGGALLACSTSGPCAPPHAEVSVVLAPGQRVLVLVGDDALGFGPSNWCLDITRVP